MFSKKSKLLIPVSIFLTAFLIRIYRISDFLFFGFEQGRDAQIIQRIYQFKDFVLVGPSTSIGGLFHGPWYYYMLAFPYGVSGGNPIAASLFLIALGSLVPVVIYLLASEILKSKKWGLACSVLAIFSYEYILYSRWLSNVSAAPLFIALSFFMLWKYITSKKRNYFLMFVLFSSIASLFQMILIPQFILVLVVLVIFKQLPKITLRICIYSFLIILFLFAPMILFDFRNEHITFNSVKDFSKLSSGGGSASFVSGAGIYFLQLYQHTVLSLINIKSLFIQSLLISSILIGAYLGYLKRKKREVIFLASWILMTLPLIKISPGNPQYYVGFGLGLILLFCFSMKIFWTQRYVSIIPAAFVLLALVSFFITINNLTKNKDVFFRTTQEDLIISDQKALLEFAEIDSKGEPYILKAFTIPSLHPEGWDYLHNFYYPDAKTQNAKIVYIAIEKDVYPVWEEKWINELGETKLDFERKFGLLRLQKRTLH